MIKIRKNLMLIGIIILTFCAVFVCTIFINYSFDLKNIGGLITSPQALAVYDGKLVMNKIIIGCAGGILGLITLFVLLFAIARYIKENQASMGVLKALGYSNMKIALPLAKFGLSVLLGASLGFIFGYSFSTIFYRIMDKTGDLPKIQLHFHYETVIILIVVPSLLFSGVSILSALLKLRKEPLLMIKNDITSKVNKLTKKIQSKEKERPFLKDLARIAIFNNLILILFVGFAALAFSAQIQLAFSVSKFTDELTFSIMLVTIGLILGAITLLIALSFVINSNKKYLAFMKGLGYTDAECNRAMFGWYRIVSYIGFALGTIYQVFLAKIIAYIFASSNDFIPEITFDLKAFFITLAVFIVLYELIMLSYKRKIKGISLKEIMQ